MVANELFKAETIGVVLAAGMGKRMNSSLPKVAHKLLGKSLVIWAIESLVNAGINKIIVVISPTQKIVEEIILENEFPSNIQINFAYQNTPLGTGHAAECGVKEVENYYLKNSKCNEINILIAYGDTPAVKPETFKEFINTHKNENNIFTVLAFETDNPTGYGRILTDKKNNFLGICEEKDCNEEQKKIKLCNSGFQCANFAAMKEYFPLLKNNNAAKEYYLTDLPLIAKQAGKKVGYLIGKDETEFLGINSQQQLAEMEEKFKEN
ncbi:NTP transferase domain-containing protein [Pigmentibacter sp. JX0631]|uniref:sugar phosphate nucleotidyltransferase n=1 Tax=Pigmentibacter sp. JX0631 TaxID=2976982 RepID=UPI002468B08C|nr:sugar phosphate nucleotidyltransferase [Pigmentibacter sp. JX0631]WGL61420.1 NTP transferase domain-containing protein [Pigmentibacter sp. JX0631]